VRRQHRPFVRRQRPLHSRGYSVDTLSPHAFAAEQSPRSRGALVCRRWCLVRGTARSVPRLSKPSINAGRRDGPGSIAKPKCEFLFQICYARRVEAASRQASGERQMKSVMRRAISRIDVKHFPERCSVCSSTGMTHRRAISPTDSLMNRFLLDRSLARRPLL
jgi:hypothetical protein